MFRDKLHVSICLFGEQGLKQYTIGSCCAFYLACPVGKIYKVHNKFVG